MKSRNYNELIMGVYISPVITEEKLSLGIELSHAGAGNWWHLFETVARTEVSGNIPIAVG